MLIDTLLLVKEKDVKVIHERLNPLIRISNLH